MEQKSEILNGGSFLKAGPLAGIKVLDLTSVVMGPYCTQALADMGASVTKIESPEGDAARQVPPAGSGGDGGIFRSLNRGKRSAVLDLQTEHGREAFLALASTADVVIHSMRLSAIQRLGLDYDAVSAVNPAVVYCNLLGYGREGRYSGQAAYDDTIQAASGLVSLQEQMTGEASYIPTVVADKVAGLTAVYAVLAALFQRQRTGEGQEVDVPMFETMASFVLVEHLSGWAFNPPIGSDPVYARLMARTRRPFKTLDGKICVIVYNQKQWCNFAEIGGRPDLIDDPRFKNLTERSKNLEDWNQVIADVICQRTTQDWLTVLASAGIPATRINSTADLFTDPHLADVCFFKEINDPVDGLLRLPGFPVRFSKADTGFDRAGPTLGEHTREVLEEAQIARVALANATN